ncbi:MAG TPA: hypothetical protein VN461_14165 [Vicinamibacteria bacterium]|nr:hypothetical protein [Vicinamibacteria bacterium]
MLQRYKLRLSDGTLLVVDHDALSSWVVDGKAMVQPVGSDRWLSLKKFLLEERRANSPWWSSKPSGEIASVHRTLLEDDGILPPARPSRELPLIPPPPRRVPTDEIVAPVLESSSGSPTLDAEPPAPVEPLPSEPEASQEVEVSLESAQAEPLRSIPEPPSIWVSEEPAALDSLSPPSVPVEEDPITLSEPFVDAETPGFSAAPGLASALPESLPAEVLNLHALAEEAAAPPPGSVGRPGWRETNAPVISLEPLGEEEPPRTTVGRRRRGPWETPLRRVAQVQVLADDTDTPPDGSALSESTPEVDASVIGLKPLDDNKPFPAAAPLVTAEVERVEPRPRSETFFLGLAPPWGPRVNRWLDRFSRLLAHFGRTLDDFASRKDLSSRWARLLAGGRSLATRPVLTRGASARPPSDSELPIIPLKLLDDEVPARERLVARLRAGLAHAAGKAVSMVTELLATLRQAAPGWSDRVRGWAPRLNRPRPVPQPPSSDESAMPDPFGRALRTPLKPPATLNELPALRLAKIEEEEVEPVYDDVFEGPGFFDVAWLWTKRATLLAGLVAGGIVAANTWEIWLPRAAQLSRMMFLEIDERVRPTVPSRAEEPSAAIRAALQAANEQLPHLAPETIELVMSKSLAGLLDPPEVFARAHDALDRGRAALTAEEAQELKALRTGMLAPLHPDERDRLYEYDLLRRHRVTLPFEDREALGLVARGMRALPPEARERFQWLAGKAITAGLSVPDTSPPRAATAS